MNPRLLMLITSALCVLLLLACGGSKQMTKTAAVSDDSPCPDWFTNVPQHVDTLFAAATATSQDLQMAINKAKQEGMADVGSQVETRLQGLTKRFQEETGQGSDSQVAAQYSAVIQTVISQTLSGCKAKYQSTKKEEAQWRACVLMQYPIGAANAQFLESIKAQKLNDQRLRAAEAFKDLESEVEKYEQTKQGKMMSNP